jgi:hypothetical protein
MYHDDESDFDDNINSAIQKAYGSVGYGSVGGMEGDTSSLSVFGMQWTNPSSSSNQYDLNKRRATITVRVIRGIKSCIILFIFYMIYCCTNIESVWLIKSLFTLKTYNDVYPLLSHNFGWNNNKELNIMIIGDQLIEHPIKEYDLINKIKYVLPTMPLNIKTHVINQIKINDILMSCEKWLLDDKPDIIFLFIESDITNITFDYNNINEIKSLYSQYNYNLHHLMAKLALNTQHVILLGPSNLGDGNWFESLNNNIYNKKSIANLYKKVNERKGNKYENSVYIDIGNQLSQKVPWWWGLYYGYVTTDGERVNKRGMYIELNMITLTIRSYYWSETLSKNEKLIMKNNNAENWEGFNGLLQHLAETNTVEEDAKINKYIIEKEILEPFIIKTSSTPRPDSASAKLVSEETIENGGRTRIGYKNSRARGNIRTGAGTGTGTGAGAGTGSNSVDAKTVPVVGATSGKQKQQQQHVPVPK